eukprot:61571_1
MYSATPMYWFPPMPTIRQMPQPMRQMPQSGLTSQPMRQMPQQYTNYYQQQQSPSPAPLPYQYQQQQSPSPVPVPPDQHAQHQFYTGSRKSWGRNPHYNDYQRLWHSNNCENEALRKQQNQTILAFNNACKPSDYNTIESNALNDRVETARVMKERSEIMDDGSDTHSVEEYIDKKQFESANVLEHQNPSLFSLHRSDYPIT